MEEKKALIYTGEANDDAGYTPPYYEVEAVPLAEEPMVPPVPRRQTASHRGLMGVMVGVAVFTIAFLLCDGAYTVRQAGRGEGPRAEWLAQLFTGNSLSITTESPRETQTGSNAEHKDESVTSTTAAAASKPQSSVGTSVSSVTPALSPEELYTYDLAAVPSGMIPIVPMDLSLSGYGENFYYNDTTYNLSLGALPEDGMIPAVAGDAEEVRVLILHTHATEGYSSEGATYYDPSTTLARAEGAGDGVIAVGEIMTELLNARGIATVHSTVLHDEASYKDSYRRSAETVQAYLKQYPSIRLVIDVHRDSIMTSADKLVRPVTVVEGQAVAQVMCVVGSDAAGGSYDGWRDNLALAVRLRNSLNADYANLARPVYVKKSTYNQQYAPASLLLEIGSSGNSLEEAKRAAVLVADCIADMMG